MMNKLSPIEVTEEGIVIRVNDKRMPKQLSPVDVTDEGNYYFFQ